ncbi:MAG: hypothetical protein M0C28_33840 [Candidatus Moduliflexus flocculans]|nr:hypothetical protein [Candidatus Moduliflexus flocculans]
MLLVSPAIALAHLIIFAGWVFFTDENRSLSWKPILVFALIFGVGLLALSASLNRSGQFDDASRSAWSTTGCASPSNGTPINSSAVRAGCKNSSTRCPNGCACPSWRSTASCNRSCRRRSSSPTIRLWQVIYHRPRGGMVCPAPGVDPVLRSREQDRGRKRSGTSSCGSRFSRGPGSCSPPCEAAATQWDNPRYRTILFVVAGGAGGRRLGLVAGDAQCLVGRVR